MSVSLRDFHFSAEQSGAIMNQFRKELGLSCGKVERLTGILDDTLGNFFGGDTRDIKLETAFKLCVVFKIPFMAYLLLMLKDADVDFMDDVLLYDPRQDEAIPVGDHDVTASSVVPDSVAAAAADTTPPDPAPTVLPAAPAFDSYTREELTAVLDRVCACHEQHVADMRANAERQQEIIYRLIEKR